MTTNYAGRCVRLELEELESREVPSSAGWVPFYGGYDLEAGTVYYDYRGIDFAPAPPTDLYFAYNGARTNHLVLFQRAGCTMAFLDGTPFEAVNYSAIRNATFTSSLIDQQFDFNDTAIIRTADGNYFKVGLAQEVSNGGYPWVSFRYEKLNDPVAALASLANSVQGALADAKPFLAKLEQAQQALTQPNADTRQDAIHHLEAFINAVLAQKDKKLTSAQADSLVGEATGIVDILRTS